jgi:cytidine deaminase
VEFPGEALSLGLHAEQSATTNAWLNGESSLRRLAVSAPPCGYCRQFLHELGTEGDLDLLRPTGSGSEYTTTPLSRSLPDALGPRDLGMQRGLMNAKHQDHGLALSSGSADPFVLMALDAAQQSYAPYTSGFAGCAIETTDGSRYPGRYAENAAYNPGMSPLESAITFMNMSRPPGTEHDLARAVLVELPSRTGQRNVATMVLASFASDVTLEYSEAPLQGPS